MSEVYCVFKFGGFFICLEVVWIFNVFLYRIYLIYMDFCMLFILYIVIGGDVFVYCYLLCGIYDFFD